MPATFPADKGDISGRDKVLPQLGAWRLPRCKLQGRHLRLRPRCPAGRGLRVRSGDWPATHLCCVASPGDGFRVMRGRDPLRLRRLHRLKPPPPSLVLFATQNTRELNIKRTMVRDRVLALLDQDLALIDRIILL